jgi:ABC-2 type transport system ATP-binding protein
MIEAENLTKYFNSFKAIEDISFSVERGEVVGLIGPNGSGKTTIMRILTCCSPPTKGTARVAGYDVLEHPLEVRRCIGYFPERAPFYPNLSVESYLAFVAEVKGVGKGERKRKIGEVMERCRISHVSRRYIENLSKGYRQRVCLAQAMINDPEVLILDEPTIGLDPKQNFEVRKLIKELAGERTVILSTHILSEVSMICRRVLIINKGRLVAEDTIEGLLKKAQEHRRILVRVKGPREEITGKLEEISPAVSLREEEAVLSGVTSYIIEAEEDVQDKISDMIVRNNWGLLEISPIGMTLEEVYIKLITEG